MSVAGAALLEVAVVGRALGRHRALADDGSPRYFGGAPDRCWDDGLHTLDRRRRFTPRR